MLISFSVQVPPAACYPISIWFRNRSPLREASYKTGSMNIACISSQQNSAGLTGSHGFALFCAAEYRGVMNKLMSQPVPTSGTPVILCAHDWNVNLQHIWSIFPWRIRQRNAPEKNGRRKFGRTIYSIFGTIPSLSHSWCWYLMPLPSPWNGYHHQIPQIPFVPVSNFW